MKKQLDRDRFDASRCQILIFHTLVEGNQALVDDAVNVEPGIRGPQFGEALRHCQDFVRYPARADRVAATTGAAIADLRGKDTEDWDFVPYAFQVGILSEVEFVQKGEPGFTPHGLLGFGTAARDGLLGRLVSSAAINEELISGLRGCNCQEVFLG